MSKTETNNSSALVLPNEDVFRKLDDVVSTRSLAALSADRGGFALAVVVADTVNQIKAHLTDEVMKPIMALQGTSLGYRTDKEKTGGTYPVEVVRDAICEAVIKGPFMPVMNEFNIIAGRAYITKEGFEGWFKRAAQKGKCSYPATHLSAPKTMGGEQAIVVAKAWCRWGNQEISTGDCEIPVKGSSPDQQLGKAKRKILARLYERCTGLTIGDGDASDAVDIQATPIPDKPAESDATAKPQQGPAPATPEQLLALDDAFKGHETAVNAYLKTLGWVTDDQTYRSLTGRRVTRILSNLAEFKKNAGI